MGRMGATREGHSPIDLTQFLELMRQIFEASQMIAEKVPQVKTAVNGIKSVQKDMKEAARLEPTDLEGLNQEFHACTLKAKRYCMCSTG